MYLLYLDVIWLGIFGLVAWHTYNKPSFWIAKGWIYQLLLFRLPLTIAVTNAIIYPILYGWNINIVWFICPCLIPYLWNKHKRSGQKKQVIFYFQEIVPMKDNILLYAKKQTEEWVGIYTPNQGVYKKVEDVLIEIKTVEREDKEKEIWEKSIRDTFPKQLFLFTYKKRAT